MTIRATSIAAAVLALAVAGSTAFAADPIETRKATMKAIGGAFGGTLVKMIKGEIPYDATAAKAAADTMVAKSAGIDVAMLFPKGSETGGDTTASPKIWADAAGFKGAMDKMKSTITAEAPNTAMGLDKLKLAVAAMGKTCKNCHDDYRIPKP